MNAGILIAAGAAESFGTGHRERMTVLYDMLRCGSAVRIRYTEDLREAQQCGPDTLLILDARDEDPFRYQSAGMILHIDNRHPGRSSFLLHAPGKAEFIDTLPHYTDSSGDLRMIAERMLIFPYYEKIKPKASVKQGRADHAVDVKKILIYTGRSGICDAADQQSDLLSRKHPVQVTRIGAPGLFTQSIEKYNKNYKFYERLSPEEFAARMSECDVFVSYFGVSIFHSLYLEKKTVFLKGISSVHDRLTDSFFAAAGSSPGSRPPVCAAVCDARDLAGTIAGLFAGEKCADLFFRPSGEGFAFLRRLTLLALQRLSEKLSS